MQAHNPQHDDKRWEKKMTTQTNPDERESQKRKAASRAGASEAVYGLGLIGAWVYYFTHSATIWIGILGFFKGIVWPAILVYEALKALALH